MGNKGGFGGCRYLGHFLCSLFLLEMMDPKRFLLRKKKRLRRAELRSRATPSLKLKKLPSQRDVNGSGRERERQLSQKLLPLRAQLSGIAPFVPTLTKQLQLDAASADGRKWRGSILLQLQLIMMNGTRNGHLDEYTLSLPLKQSTKMKCAMTKVKDHRKCCGEKKLSLPFHFAAAKIHTKFLTRHPRRQSLLTVWRRTP
mmetsp:Transcript_41359/g.107106  ORF Transcript_41359/g.107106 Transcript_41359/m.107106 type:complete len:200 (+) Transcript_41359:798-1397(+)